MTFDKAAYWAQKGTKRPRGRMVTVICCRICKGTEGTLQGRSFKCVKGCAATSVPIITGPRSR